MRTATIFLYHFIILAFPSFSQSKLSIDRPDYFDFVSLYKKNQLVQTIDSFLAVVNDREKVYQFWDKQDIEEWGYPSDFVIMGNNNRKPFF